MFPSCWSITQLDSRLMLLVGMVHVYFHVLDEKPDTGYVIVHGPSFTQMHPTVFPG